MNTSELKAVLEAHAKWRLGEPGGARANLAGAYLAGANLARADLAGADLAGADLAGANLAGADLAGADLAGANLAGADLAGANLAGADLAGANLAGADLADADLAGANLTRAYLADADLAGANLTRAYLADAYLAGAYLAGAYLADAYLAGADLADADLAGAKNVPSTTDLPKVTREEWQARRAKTATERAMRYREQHPEIPVVEQLDSKILAAITDGVGSLNMSDWHTCATTHCRAGWAITLAGPAGYELEKKLGPHGAGAAIYRASTGRVPHFYASTQCALEDIKRCAAAAGAGKEAQNDD